MFYLLFRFLSFSLFRFLLRSRTSEHRLDYLQRHAFYSLKNRRYSNQITVGNLNNLRQEVCRHFRKKGEYLNGKSDEHGQ